MSIVSFWSVSPWKCKNKKNVSVPKIGLRKARTIAFWFELDFFILCLLTFPVFLTVLFKWKNVLFLFCFVFFTHPAWYVRHFSRRGWFWWAQVQLISNHDCWDGCRFSSWQIYRNRFIQDWFDQQESDNFFYKAIFLIEKELRFLSVSALK